MDSATVNLLISIAAVVFGAGGAFYALHQLKREVRLLWQKFDAVDDRERRHYTKLLVALTAIAASVTNPHPRADVMEMLKKMAEEGSQENP